MAKKVRKTIKVTSREVDAAKSLVRLDRVLGRPSDPSVVLIANAKPVLLGGSIAPRGGVIFRKDDRIVGGTPPHKTEQTS